MDEIEVSFYNQVVVPYVVDSLVFPGMAAGWGESGVHCVHL